MNYQVRARCQACLFIFIFNSYKKKKKKIFPLLFSLIRLELDYSYSYSFSFTFCAKQLQPSLNFHIYPFLFFSLVHFSLEASLFIHSKDLKYKYIPPVKILRFWSHVAGIGVLGFWLSIYCFHKCIHRLALSLYCHRPFARGE